MDSRLGEFVSLVESDTWLYELLRLVTFFPDQRCYIGAGAIRDVVWDKMTGIQEHDSVKDIDVVYFDPLHTDEGSEKAITQYFSERWPQVEWDVKNQAAVHLWFPKVFGYDVAPFENLDEAVASWPEYASAVAVRWEDDTYDVIAPYGVDDLLDMRVRRNPIRVTEEEYRRRVARKNYSNRWPRVVVEHA